MTYNINIHNKAIELYCNNPRITISRIIVSLNKEFGVAPSCYWIESVIKPFKANKKNTTNNKPILIKKVSKKIYKKKIPTCISLTPEVSIMLIELAEKFKSSKSDIVNSLFSEKFKSKKYV